MERIPPNVRTETAPRKEYEASPFALGASAVSSIIAKILYLRKYLELSTEHKGLKDGLCRFFLLRLSGCLVSIYTMMPLRH